jgi:hypothetical protein
MATIPRNYTRLQTSSPGDRTQPGILVTTVIPRRPVPNRQPAPRVASLFTLPNEPEDARLTGGTRSLDRRLLALNLSGSLARTGPLAGPNSAEHAPGKSKAGPERVAAPSHSAVA